MSTKPRSAPDSHPKTTDTPPAKTELINPDDIVCDPFDAKECVKTGNAIPLGRYLREDVSTILDLVADQLEAGNLRKPSRRKPSAAMEEEDGEEWVSDTSETKECVRAGSAVAAASFLRDLTGLIELLGGALDRTSKDWKLLFEHSGPGNPADRMTKMLKASRIRREVLFSPFRRDKLESAVSDVMKKLHISRAKVFRAIASKSKSKKAE